MWNNKNEVSWKHEKRVSKQRYQENSHPENSHPSNSPRPAPPPLENPTRKITTQKILTWNIPTHGFNHSHSSFQIFCFFIIVAVIIDIT